MIIFTRKEKTKPEQFGLGIQTKEKRPLSGFNRKLHNLEMKLEVMPFWKNFSFVFYALSSLIIPGGIIALMLYKFNQIPVEIPLFYNPQISSWVLIDKSIAIILPIIYAIANLVLLNLNYSIFQYDRRLSQVLAFTMNISNILFLIAFAEILSIVLI
ncbi:MAG: hypothetical protein US52_C0012G0011 [candidate division WS6 bacterium GW2011_GWA2_37_6]|uniref:Uncharacterized protein n=1 Tax=candidate division WS6 bacterium GW2011_GWA2_37_6 TaxID=1619087 RepID=A0A0G0K5Q7_9BACT|nr:MAG: hypothetical protein US52_C0012G0011 [candidate division WS6 bacterium GW2011_GWA2_37_6]